MFEKKRNQLRKSPKTVGKLNDWEVFYKRLTGSIKNLLDVYVHKYKMKSVNMNVFFFSHE